MKVLVINTGSSSIKFELFQMPDEHKICFGCIEKIGKEDSLVTYAFLQMNGKMRVITMEEIISDHSVGMKKIVDLLLDEDIGVVKDQNEIHVIGHRVVHGGESFTEPIEINEMVIRKIKENIPLAPLHNPSNLTGINISQEYFPNAKHVAVFDTAFHQTLPAKAYLYALPMDYYTKHKVRRYGFHGTSHAFVADEAAKLMDKPLHTLNLITIHLGNGASMAAIQKGVCVDTSMGMTPLAGLVMGTRSGDIDPAIPFFMANYLNMSLNDIDHILNNKSGLKGLCGENDMREVLKRSEENDEKAHQAIEMYTYRIKKYIGSYTAVLGNVDGIVYTGGIGENSDVIRKLTLENLESFGIQLDDNLNKIGSIKKRILHKESSKIKLFVIPTNEELQIARKSFKILN